MFGYVTPIKEKLSCCDFTIYRSYYCGICKAIGKLYGQLPRFTTNYDTTFLGVLLSSFLGVEPVPKMGACVANPFKKRQFFTRDQMLDKIAASNIILSYYKALDGVLDKEGFKYKLAKRSLNRSYKKTLKTYSELDKIVDSGYNDLRFLEKDNCASLDRVADCFATLLKKVAAYFLDIADSDLESPDHYDILSLFYNIGKFVYIVDALDDIADDYKKKRYNPFLSRFSDFTTRIEFIDKNRDELEFIFAACVNRAIESYNNIAHKFTFGADLIKNIIYLGLRAKVDELLSSDSKLKKPKI